MAKLGRYGFFGRLVCGQESCNSIGIHLLWLGLHSEKLIGHLCLYLRSLGIGFPWHWLPHSIEPQTNAHISSLQHICLFSTCHTHKHLALHTCKTVKQICMAALHLNITCLQLHLCIIASQHHLVLCVPCFPMCEHRYRQCSTCGSVYVRSTAQLLHMELVCHVCQGPVKDQGWVQAKAWFASTWEAKATISCTNCENTR